MQRTATAVFKDKKVPGYFDLDHKAEVAYLYAYYP